MKVLYYGTWIAQECFSELYMGNPGLGTDLKFFTDSIAETFVEFAIGKDQQLLQGP